MKLPPDIERRYLELAGESPIPKSKPAKVELVEPSHPSLGVWVVPYECVNESNQRSWRARNRRAGAAWKAVQKAIRIHQISGIALVLDVVPTAIIRAHFVRLGGKRLDPLVGLPSSLKGVEDAVAYLLGIDDGDPRWKPTCDQEPGGPCGVRIELQVTGA